MVKKFKLNMVSMPNFITYETPAGQKQDGIDFNKNTIPVSELTQEEAAEYAEWMRLSFLGHWERKVKSK